MLQANDVADNYTRPGDMVNAIALLVLQCPDLHLHVDDI